MDLLEVLALIKKENDPDLWFRPVGWQGFAYVIQEGITLQVPNNTGGVRYMTDYVDELLGRWEIVLADDVLGEQ